MRKRMWMVRLGLTGGLLQVGGCFAAFERNLDLVLAVEATQNLLRAPLSALLPLARLFSLF